jgi:photosystem II stability/assembly factor-like uncharacterized protein
MALGNFAARCSKSLLALSIACSFTGSAQLIAQDSDKPKDETPQLNEGLIGSLSARCVGPALMSGRIVDIAIDPSNRSNWYIAVASGGVWKSTNAGITWNPIFDGYGSYSIGCLAIDASNPNVIWVGTGENNSQRSVGYGDGVYKSLDGGKSFQKVGLENSEHIGRIWIDPRDSETVFVASQGPLWAPGGDRGLYKTTDGGRSWTRVLNVSENTGISEVIADPRDPDTMYASAYQRRRHQWTLIDGGPESGIFKSIDGGQTWRPINRGLPGGDRGRIGLAISPIQPDVLYAIVEAVGDEGGFFRSTDRGESWSKQSSHVSGSPQYYQELIVDPNVMDRIYSMDTMMMVSDDGGKTFRPVGERFKHVDNHALYIDPSDSNHLIVGCDGGLYESFDRGANYRYTANLPITQFYKIAVDNALPFYNVYGGTQDNATQGGPSRTRNVHGIRNSDWFVTVFGDGFDPAVDPNDPNTVYSQWQYGGLVRFDRRTGERIDIKPQESADGPPLRWNWDSPLLISPHNPSRIYYASQILFRSDDRGDSWQAISTDLSRNLDRNQLKVMGRVWGVDSVAKNTSTSFYGNITAVSESPVAPNLLYVGTDDGLIQVSEDGGTSWRKIEKFEFLDVPEFAYVSDIEASRHNADTVYVVVNNFKRGDFRPYVLKSADRGKSWTVLSQDLPVRGSTYTIAEDHVKPELLFVGTEFGLFTTLDGGKKWLQMRGGLPTIAVRELEVQRRENDLVIGTFGRGIYIVDDYSPLRSLTQELVDSPAAILPIKPALMYLEDDPMGGSSKAFQGAGFYTAENPAFGANITYYIKDSLKTKKGDRKKRDRGLSASGQDTPYPSWENLKAEDREDEPRMMMIIRDAQGNVVRRLPASTSSGMHRMTWDLQHAGLAPHRIGSDGNGPMALPGTYTASLVQFENGELKELVAPTSFECKPLIATIVTPEQKAAALAFQNQTSEVQRVILAANQILNESQTRVEHIKSVIERSPRLNLDLYKSARELEMRLLDISDRLVGDPTRPQRQEPEMPGLLERLQQVVQGSWASSLGPTQTHRKNFEVVTQKLPALLDDLRKAIEVDLVAIEKQLEDAGAPWTPGRSIPKWPR